MQLSLSLLGRFRLTRAGLPIELKTNKARGLLALLATDAGRPYRRETLAGLLWPDHSEVSARDNLRVTLYQLRRLLGERENTRPFLIFTRETVQFNAKSDFWLDVAEFTALVDECECHQHASAEACSSCMRSYARAAELYQGEFLESFPEESPLFDEWVLIQRERLNRKAVAIFDRLAAFHLERGEWAQAEEYARRHLRFEPWDENAYRDLIRALALSGRRDAALRQFEHCRATLAGEMGIKPEAATSALYQQIRDGLLGGTGVNPYKGVRAFQEEDVQDFFGRTSLVTRLLVALQSVVSSRKTAPRFLALIGPSGSGKSSVVRAGLVPALRHDALAGSGGWLITTMLPGAEPLSEVAAALRRVAPAPPTDLGERLRSGAEGLHLAANSLLPGVTEDGTARLVLVIDQFEEVFRLGVEERERRLFLDSLAYAATVPQGRCVIIVTLRTDFYDHCLHHPAFGMLVRAQAQTVPSISEKEMREAIERPAQAAGLHLEAGLTDAIIVDVRNQPGTLPLLQAILTELADRRDGTRLTLVAYRSLGGVKGVLSRRADELCRALSLEAQTAVRQLLLALGCIL